MSSRGKDSFPVNLKACPLSIPPLSFSGSISSPKLDCSFKSCLTQSLTVSSTIKTVSTNKVIQSAYWRGKVIFHTFKSLLLIRAILMGFRMPLVDFGVLLMLGYFSLYMWCSTLSVVKWLLLSTTISEFILFTGLFPILPDMVLFVWETSVCLSFLKSISMQCWPTANAGLL